MRTETLKALLRKDWRLSRKYYISGLIAMVILAAVFMLFALSMQFGNLRNLAEDERAVTKVVIGFLGCFTMLLMPHSIAGTDANLHRADLDANWLRYSYSLPVSPKERAFSRFLLITAAQLIAIVISIAGMAVISKFQLNRAVTWRTVLIPVLCSTLVSLVLLVTVFFTTKARDRKAYGAQNTKAAFILMGAGLALGLYLSKRAADLATAAAKLTEPDASLSTFLYMATFGQPERALALFDIALIASIPVWILLHVLLWLALYRNLKRSVIA